MQLLQNRSGLQEKSLFSHEEWQIEFQDLIIHFNAFISNWMCNTYLFVKHQNQK